MKFVTKRTAGIVILLLVLAIFGYVQLRKRNTKWDKYTLNYKILIANRSAFPHHATPQIFMDNYKLINITKLKRADIYSKAGTGVKQCGISFRAKFLSDQPNNLSGQYVQIKSVFTHLSHFRSEWHMRSLFAYSLDRLLGLNITPTTFLILLDRETFKAEYIYFERSIRRNLFCVPTVFKHYITGTATVWEPDIRQIRWPNKDMNNLPEYDLLLYLANCKKSVKSHFKSTKTNTYRNIDTDRCFMQNIPNKAYRYHLLNKSICKLPIYIMQELLLNVDTSLENEKYGPTIGSCLSNIYKDYQQYNVTIDKSKLFAGVDQRIAEVVSKWKNKC